MTSSPAFDIISQYPTNRMHIRELFVCENEGVCVCWTVKKERNMRRRQRDIHILKKSRDAQVA